MTGLVVIDKPQGISSAAVVARVRRAVGVRRVGHCGTLDPLATGVLVTCVGRASRLQDLLMNREKAYRATIALGATSRTDDAEGPVEAHAGACDSGEAAVRAALSQQVGEIAQTPPAFSAVHVDGTRAYTAARRGVPLDVPARVVAIHAIEVVRYEWPEVEIDVRCGKGTYIRSIARDLGEALGVGGYLARLRRTRACGIGIEDAVPLESIDAGSVIPLARVLAGEPRLELAAEHLEALVGGATVACEHPPEPGAAGELFAWVDGDVVAWVAPVPGGVRSRALLT